MRFRSVGEVYGYMSWSSICSVVIDLFFFFQAEDGIRDYKVTGVQTCALPIYHAQAIGADLWRLGQDFNFSGDKQQWGWAGRGRRYAGLAYPALRGANQLVNASEIGRASCRERV